MIAVRDSTIRHATIYLSRTSREASGQLRDKKMRASKPSNEIKNQAADPNFFWQSFQRGIRIIVIETFFATPFSELIRLAINSCKLHL
jgi:hypothetical protein